MGCLIRAHGVIYEVFFSAAWSLNCFVQLIDETEICEHFRIVHLIDLPMSEAIILL